MGCVTYIICVKALVEVKDIPSDFEWTKDPPYTL
jgi:hypothetical protein